MNLVNFMNKVDALTESCDKDKLVYFIHETARMLPEKMRKDFIKNLESISDEDKKDTVDVQQNNFKGRYDEINAYIEKIESGEYCLQQEWNEEYDDWYDDDSEECYYEDPDGIVKLIISICDYIHDCKDVGDYNIAGELGRKLFALHIQVDSDYGNDTLSVKGMQECDLLQINLKNIALDTLYSCYMSVDEKELPKTLYEIFCNSKINDLYIENLLQYADKELENFEQFLAKWISYLGEISEKEAERLYMEAVDFTDNIDVKIKNAQKYVATHPGVYKLLLEDTGYSDIDKMIEIGMDGIKRIDKLYLVRSEVALKTAEFILISKTETSLLESCYIAAFESNTNATNYLRCFLNCKNQTDCKRQLNNILKNIFINCKDKPKTYYMSNILSMSNIPSELKENEPEKNMIYILRMLNGEFLDVLYQGVTSKASLGWTGTFMKEGLAFFLLYLYDGDDIPKGIQIMLENTKKAFEFTYEEYAKGQILETDKDETMLFYDCFLRWKSTVVSDDNEKNEILNHIEKMMEKRVEGIMDANRRNYYGECAAFIAAIGEVKESWGKVGEKQRFMEYYREKYSRRYAFREELGRCGWIKGK